jgi:hypothetical protein
VLWLSLMILLHRNLLVRRILLFVQALNVPTSHEGQKEARLLCGLPGQAFTNFPNAQNSAKLRVFGYSVARRFERLQHLFFLSEYILPAKSPDRRLLVNYEKARLAEENSAGIWLQLSLFLPPF